MNKTELVAFISENAGLTKADATRALEATIDGIMEGTKNGKVTLVGFGTFEMKRREARIGRNPRTGEEVTIAARNAVNFKAGNKFKEELN
ncbi:MAG: HU family DNA-binding protein [Bacilli bacterium]